MKRILIALVVLLIAMSMAVPSFADGGEITKEMMEEATPADEDTILIEIAREEEATGLWGKYFYFDVNQDQNENS